jgi:hypothetical protein
VLPAEERANSVKADFLLIDSEVALTFCGIALQATDLEKKERTTKEARKAYDTILRLKRGVALLDIDAERLVRDLRRIKSELEVLGETF